MFATTTASLAFALFVIGLATDLHASTMSRDHPRFWTIKLTHTFCFAGLTLLFCRVYSKHNVTLIIFPT